jgi:DNA polymerase-1
MQKQTLYLVDGTSICYRSFFAIKLSTSKGYPTGAIYGFFNTLKRIIKKFQPLYMGVCFDVSRKTFRQEKFKDYKIQRPPVPGALQSQLSPIKKLIESLGIKIIEKEGFEADDLISSLTQKALKERYKVMIVTSDKDIYQLIHSDKVLVYDPVKDKIYGEDDFIQEYGFIPSSIVDYLALVGDSTDNIPGAKGIGKVGATKLIQAFGSIENIFCNLDKLSPKLRKSLIDNRERVFLSKELASLAQLELEFDWQNLKIGEPDYQQIYKMFKEFEFKSLLAEIPAPSLNVKIDVQENIPPDLKQKILDDGQVIFYCDNEDIYILADDESKVYKGDLNQAREILEDKKIRKISYDLKEIKIRLKERLRLQGLYFDVKIASYIINSTLLDFSMESLVASFLNIFTREILPHTFPYLIFKLYQVLSPQLKGNKLENLFFNIEMPLVEVLADIESWGIKIDRGFLEQLLENVNERAKRVSRQIFQIAGEEFNLNSPQQLREVLYDKLNLPPLKRTKTGFSTDEEVLTKLAPNYPIASLLLEYRELIKLKSTYLIPFLEEAVSCGGRIYAKFNQTGTQTGRLSSSSPNLQNIPAKSELARKVRGAFISSFPEGLILSCDYSQIELRILAHLSEEPALIDAFKKDLDIHRFTASLIFGIPQESVSSSQREIAKRVNFGIIYGMSPYGLAKELNISPQEATSFIDSYFLRYPKVKEYIDRVKQEAQDQGYVMTLLGRTRFLPDLNSPNYEIREFSYRQALNSPIQGSAADIIKLAMVGIHREFKKENLQSKMLIQIHDELVFDVDRRELELVAQLAREKMERALELKVPLKVNLKVGKNWLEMEEIQV